MRRTTPVAVTVLALLASCAVGPTRVLVMTRDEHFMKRRRGTRDVVIATGSETAATLTIES